MHSDMSSSYSELLVCLGFHDYVILFLRYDMIQWTIFTRTQKLTNSRLNLPPGTKEKKSNEETKKEKKSEETKNKKTEMLLCCLFLLC